MAVYEDIARLVLDVQGGQQVSSELARAEQGLRDLQGALQAGAIGFDQFESESDQLVARLTELRSATKLTDDVLEGLATSSGRISPALAGVGDAAEVGGSKVAGFGQSALQAGRVVQDFYQGGVLGVLNNIEGLTVALGGGAGLAGILTLVGVGFSMLQPQIKEFIEGLKGGIPRELLDGLKDLDQDLATAKDRFQELSEQSRLSLSEVMEYYKLRDQIKQQEQEQAERKQDAKLDTLSPAFDKEVAQGVQQAIAEGGGRGQAEEEIVQAQINAAESRGEGYQVEELRKNAAALLRDATAGTGQSQGARDQIAKMLRDNIPGQSNFAAGLEVQSPEFAEADRQFDEQIAARQAAVRRRDQARQQAKQLDRQLTEQGQQNEEAGQEAERRAADQAQKQAEQEQVKRQRTSDAAFNDLYKSATGSTIDERAAAYAGQLAARGASPEQQQDALRTALGREIRQSRPDLNPLEVSGLTSRLTRAAQQRAGDVFGQQRDQLQTQAQMNGRQLSASQLNVLATQSTLQALQALIPRVDAVERQAQRNLRAAESMARSALRRGGR